MGTIPKSSEDEEQHFCMSTRSSKNKDTRSADNEINDVHSAP
jgi:hypothetical protein